MQGQLFSFDFLQRGVLQTPPCQAFDTAAYEAFVAQLQSIYQGLDESSPLNEAQTESHLILPTLKALGWGDDVLPQVNLSARRREDVPDLLLFANAQAKAAALPLKDDQRYRHGVAILEAKRWLRPLDRGDLSEAYDPDAPSSQMLRYLSRADAVSQRVVKWGILCNGAVWRLYWQDARSRAQEFFEVPLVEALREPQRPHDFDEIAPAHALRLFYLFFQRAAFLPQDWDTAGRSFHAYALDEARLYEERVSQDLGTRVFNDVFAQLATALARSDAQAQTQTEATAGAGAQFTTPYLSEVREATLVLLYRLLFLLYAEDRHLLPVRDARYAPYSVRRIRLEVRDKTDAQARFSSTIGPIWQALRGAFDLLNLGDKSIGVPPYNGGLFAPSRAPLLQRVLVPDAVMAPIIDALSRRTEDVLRGWINYRDLSVSHLGSIYERLLEYTLVHEEQRSAEATAPDPGIGPDIRPLVARPASFARKVSGSYYTHDDLVRLVLKESVGVLAQEREQAFAQHLQSLSHRTALNPAHWDAIDALDPASQILNLKICDPAMGSGHFLVSLVDDLADRVLEAMTRASDTVNQQAWAAHLSEAGKSWQSPVLQRVAHIRRSIKNAAQQGGWAVSDAQLDDRHIVRRMVLKKCIFGVDKNPMAVELAKTALWLHSFTVGAPLSFLDHHLQTGDSLHGERIVDVQADIQALGALLLQSEFDRLQLAGEQLAQVADLTDADIAQARLSQQLASEAAAQLAPIHAVLDFWRALRWLLAGWPVSRIDKLGKLLKPQADGQSHPHLRALARLLHPSHNLVQVLASGKLDDVDAAEDDDSVLAQELMAQARALAQRETFFHWWSSFPTVFGPQGQGGFDAVIGNPPWDRIKLQEVEWFAERHLGIAAQARAADRKRLIAQLKKNQDPLWQDYQAASERAETQARVLGNGKLGCGDYPLLGGGDINLYSLFIERAQSLLAKNGIVALITPSGIAADKGAAAFFQSISQTGRLGALFDFENRKVFFPDVDGRFKFCALVFGGPERRFAHTRCAFFLHQLQELDAPERTLILSAQDFARVNPNTGAAPIFRSQRDADITLALYQRLPVLVRHSPPSANPDPPEPQKVWPVKYSSMFHMTNDSHLFLKAEELQAQGFVRSRFNRWRKGGQEALPLYEGKMVQMYDHRAADVVVNATNLHRPAQQVGISIHEKTKPDRYPQPQYFVLAKHCKAYPTEWALGYKEITAPTNVRSMIAALLPRAAFGNKVPLLLPETPSAAEAARVLSLLAANLNSIAFDYVLRQKLQGQTINLFILEQLPVIPPARFNDPLPKAFVKAARHARLMNGHHAQPSVADFVIPQVLALSYTAHDLAPFAVDLCYVDAQGSALPPFVWDEEERRQRMAALDAVFFWLYGLNPDDALHVLNSFPIVREQDEKLFGEPRTEREVLHWLGLLQA